ncbi:MAG: valine--tRNA ligase, partial [Candidatus Pacebacteria bacterium]|nr:valine--tRNA ligase [Candidatus Paceibacterota bacterium]
HAGHGLTIALEDIMTRYQRMQGKKALWVPGADHAGFETQSVYEKKLEKEGRSRFKMDPQDLYNEIMAFTLDSKKNMESDVRALGASCDWSRECFTLDPVVVKEAQETFRKLYRDDLVYRGYRTINWCPKHQTSLSDVETESVEQKTPFYYFKYGPFEIGTVRPETKFGDKYVVMHPDDKRYANYKDGQKLELEWINGPITATIIKDSAIDMEFGTGVMTITPWHSGIDFEIAKRHNLDIEQIIDWRGKLLPIAGEFAGVGIKDARPKIVEKLKAKGLLVRVDENYNNIAKCCYKCNTMIEPQIKNQWFVKMEPLAKMAGDAVRAGKIRFIPENFEKIFLYWMDNTIDWNISRQIVWGIQIPALVCQSCNTGALDTDKKEGEACKCGGKFTRDTDTFDTWFSSGQWPLLALGYPNKKDLIYYPTDVMETGRDLIFKWIPRMVIFGLYLKKEVPFKTVYLHGMVNDKHGKKMSKSKGNVISPIELSGKYGADALRIALVIGNTPGSDLSLAEEKIKGYKHFCNKMWNASRFVLSNIGETTLETKQPKLTPRDEEIMRELNGVVTNVTEHFENFRFHLAGEELYHYFWHSFADIILEEMKPRLSGDDASSKESARYVLLKILSTTVKMLHPFIPFITEELWSMLPRSKKTKDKNLLIVEPWPISS